MTGIPRHQLPEPVLTASRLPVARRTHRKRRNHRDSHGVTNNILALYSILLRNVIILSSMNLGYPFYPGEQAGYIPPTVLCRLAAELVYASCFQSTLPAPARSADPG